MEEESEFRRWDELIPDALGLIFTNLTLQEILTVIPRVCKSWGRAVAGPYCWQEIDIMEWSKFQPPETILRMLQMLIIRSSGSLRKLCVAGLPNDQSFSLIADHAKSLRTLQLPRGQISDSIVEQVAERLSAITFMDVSYCKTIGSPALEAIGKHCKHLRKLQRCMHGWEVLDKVSQDDEALAIAATMPKLKHLEIHFLRISTEAVHQILSKCRELQLLDVRGCYSVKLDDKIVKKFSGLKVVGPGSDNEGWDNCSNYSVSSGYLAWDFVAGYSDEETLDEAWEDDQSMEDIEMRFYDGFYLDNGGFDWPLSP